MDISILLLVLIEYLFLTDCIFSLQELRRIVIDDSVYDGASWYRRHRGDPPISLVPVSSSMVVAGEDPKRALRRKEAGDKNIAFWDRPDVDLSADSESDTIGCCDEASGDSGVFGSLFV